MIKSPMRLAALIAVGAIAVSACSSAASPSPSAAPSAAASAAASVAPSAEAPSTAPSTAPSPSPEAVGCATDPVKLTFWTKEGDTSLEYVKALTAGYTAAYPNVTFEVVNKDVETLRQDFQTASLAGSAPDLLWTVADHVGPFTAADLILPMDGLVDTSVYLPNAVAAVQADGKTWGVPISYGNQLMLYWNKGLVGDAAPADTAALAAKAKELTTADKYGLVFNQTESFWLVPFLGGYNGSVFAADGKTPTLDTPEMTSALQLLYDWKFTDKVMPKEADYNVADGMFKDGTAAMIINGDWAMGDYKKAIGDKLGVGPIPKITGADMPKPYTAGAFYMVPKQVGDDANKQCVVLDFVKWSTNQDNQIQMVKDLSRLPALITAIEDPIVTGDALLAGAAEAVKLGIPQPTNLEMRCVFDSMTTGVRDLFGKGAMPADIAAAMQKSADAGVAPGGVCGE
jgi:arabinogalactan oligomer/maltooligosaccharide transport system substrate-binding protein